MLHPCDIKPDEALAAMLKDTITVDTAETKIPVYADWARPTNGLPDDFIVVYVNGAVGGVGMDTPFARGNLIVSLYNRLNDDGSVKSNRIKKILRQFDITIEASLSGGYHFEYEPTRFITPTTPNQTTGYSITSLNLRWTTTSTINQQIINQNG